MKTLDFFESKFYGLIFISSILYSVIKFYQTSNVHLGEIYQSDLQYGGWISRTIVDRPLDVSDLEWQVFKEYYLDTKILFLLFHSIGFQLTRLLFSKYLSIFIVLYSTLTLGYLLSIKYLVLIYLNIGIIFLLEPLQNFNDFLKRSRIFHYLFFVYSIVVIHELDFDADRKQNLLVHVSFSWLNAKLLCCSIDFYNEYIAEEKSIFSHIFIRLAYLLYFPPFFFGPIYHFSDFEKSLKHLDSRVFTRKTFFKNVRQLFKYLLWALFLEIVLHFIYSSSFQYYVYLTINFDSWSLCGLGYSLMILFFMKYFVIYGMSRQWTLIDGLENVLAKPPECIAHIYQTSYLWRKFDRGLYQFLIKYFYKPLSGSHRQSILRKFLASFVCFIIIAFWHGYYQFSIIIWVTMNIILSYLDRIGTIIFEFKALKSSKRMKAMFESPLLASAYISNIFFLSNYETGMLFVTKILFGFSLPLLMSLFIFYCGCYVCQQINERIK